MRFDSELYNENEIIADIVQAALSPGVHGLICIVPNEEAKNRVEDMIEIIFNKLTEDLGATEREIPYYSVLVLDKKGQCS